jgi:hypothetical protein
MGFNKSHNVNNVSPGILIFLGLKSVHTKLKKKDHEKIWVNIMMRIKQTM